jgi:hypothetical protein
MADVVPRFCGVVRPEAEVTCQGGDAIDSGDDADVTVENDVNKSRDKRYTNDTNMLSNYGNNHGLLGNAK